MASIQHWRLSKGQGAAVLLHMLLNTPRLAQAQAPIFKMKSDTHFPAAAPEVSSSLEANDVSILESDGIDVTFGTDWSKRIHDTVATNCGGEVPSTQCQDQVKQVLGLGTTEKGLQARMIPLLAIAGAAVANVIGAVIMILKTEQPPEVLRVHIPQDQNKEMYVLSWLEACLPEDSEKATETFNAYSCHLLTVVSLAFSASWDTSSGNFTMQPVDGEAFGVDMVGFKPSSPPPRFAFPLSSHSLDPKPDVVV